MTKSKRFALIGGSMMLGMGAAAFVPALSTSPHVAGLPRLGVETSYGKFLGVFPLNIFNKSALTVFGVLGIAAGLARSERPARLFSKAVAFVMGPLAVLGAIPRTQTMFGALPLFGAEVAAHGAFATAGAIAAASRSTVAPSFVPIH